MILLATKYRSRTDIIVSMLEAAKHGATKTRVVYSSYLSSHQLRTYLQLVMSHGLLEYDSMRGQYRTTKRGLSLLELHGSLCNLDVFPSLR